MSDAPVYIKRESALAHFKSLKDDGFDVLMDLFVVDYLHWEEKAERFEVVYNLYYMVRAVEFIEATIKDYLTALQAVGQSV